MKRWPLPLVASFLLFLALCATLAYWALQFFAPAQRPVAAAPAVAAESADLSAAASLFGGSGNMTVASNFELQGVILSGNNGQSIAILSANGEPAKAITVGTEVASGITVQEVHRGYVLLSDNGAVKRVELPLEPPMLGSGSAAPLATRAGDSAGASANGTDVSSSTFGRRRAPSALQEQQAREAAQQPQAQPDQGQPAPSQPAAAPEQSPTSQPSAAPPMLQGATGDNAPQGEAGTMSAAPVLSGQPSADPETVPDPVPGAP